MAECGVHGVREVVEGVHEQQGQQLVAAGDVAIERRGDHPHLPGDLAQRQSGHALRLELGAGDLEDALHGLLPRLLAGRRSGLSGHAPILARTESTALAIPPRAVFTVARAVLSRRCSCRRIPRTSTTDRSQETPCTICSSEKRSEERRVGQEWGGRGTEEG